MGQSPQDVAEMELNSKSFKEIFTFVLGSILTASILYNLY